jgi:prepilin-type N-terminal cleavage/methylation domain-containing protein
MPFFPAGKTRLAQSRPGFTLTELLAVMAIAIIVMTLIVPAVTGMKRGGDVTNASYVISGALDTARAYAKANSTYVWVGFFEENEAVFPPSPAVAGTGRVTISIVASNDGTPIYNTSALIASPTTQQPIGGFTTTAPITPRLSQVGKLIHLDNMHLAGFSDGTGTGTTFLTRPAVNDATAHIGSSSESVSVTPFYYPISATTGTAQYTFVEAIEFSPRGEARLNNASSGYKPIIEVGLLDTHGTTVDAAVDSTGQPVNPIAVQVTGIVGTVTIYRK